MSLIPKINRTYFGLKKKLKFFLKYKKSCSRDNSNRQEMKGFMSSLFRYINTIAQERTCFKSQAINIYRHEHIHMAIVLILTGIRK